MRGHLRQRRDSGAKRAYATIFRLAALALCLLAAGNGRGATVWEHLGAREFDLKGDYERIEVARSEGRFNELQIRVKGAPIEITRMVVTFGNDEKFTVTLHHRFAEGSGSRMIDLTGDRRPIKRIELVYHSINRREGKGRVEVYAR